MKNSDHHSAAWLPYAQMKTALAPIKVVSTSGTRIRLDDGRELIDGIASWWTACHGYNHPYIIGAMQKQLASMPHVMFGGLVHEPALNLAERLAKLAPGDLNHVFFSESGSVSVEVALKMAVQYRLNRDEQGYIKFLSFRDGYHGDTMASMAVTDPGENAYTHVPGYERFREHLPEQCLADLPRDDASTTALDALMQREKLNIAAVIVEPLVQGVGGMKFHDINTLKRIADLCKKHGLLLILDEIFTGFGRTGSVFACEQAGIVPDIMCVGKGLTGGAITLAATIARSHVYEAFLSDDPKKAFMHGGTYMASPLACAAANASLDLFESEPRMEQTRAIEKQLCEELEPCRGMSGVLDVRVKGAIGVVQMAKIDDMHALRMQFIKHNVWVRPFANTIYLAPALTIDTQDLSKLTSAIVNVVSKNENKAAA